MNAVRRTLGLWLFVLLVILAGPLLAAEYTGRVVGVQDGDTLTLLVPDGASYQQVKIRLGEIDTPESNGQPYAERAKQALSDLAFGKQARVVVQDTDRYGRRMAHNVSRSFRVSRSVTASGSTLW
jgi:endonuclease YncB( thermonuclease family)